MTDKDVWPDEIEPKPEKKPMSDRFEAYMDKVMDVMEKYADQMGPQGTPMPLDLSRVAFMPPSLQTPYFPQVRIFSAKSPQRLQETVNGWLKTEGRPCLDIRDLSQLKYFAGEFHLVLPYTQEGEISEAARLEYERQVAEFQEKCRRAGQGMLDAENGAAVVDTAESGDAVPESDARIDEGNQLEEVDDGRNN